MTKINLLLKEGYTSQNLFEKINLLEISTINAFNDGMNWVKDNNINATLVGGTAVINYLGSKTSANSINRVLTPDVDYLVDDLTLLKNKLKKDDIKYTDLISNSGTNIGITVPKFNIDFLDSINDSKQLGKLALKSALTTNIGGNSINIISPELLSIVKLDLGRTKDLNDGFALLQSGKLNKDKYIKLANGMKSILNDYNSIISYAEMI